MRAWCDYCDNGCELCSGSNPERSEPLHSSGRGSDYHLERRLRNAEICIAMLAELLRSNAADGPPITHVRLGAFSLALHDWMPLCDEFEKEGIAELERRRQQAIRDAEENRRRLEAKRKRLADELRETEEELRRS
jgi:hypothetical protein